MRAQILMLRTLGEAYGKQGDIADEAGDLHDASLLHSHASAHLAAADTLEAQHRHELSLLNLAAGPIALGMFSPPCVEMAGGTD